MKTKTHRICAGEYEVAEVGNSLNPARVRVTRIGRDSWIAAACWDAFLYTDFLPTKALAVINADLMIREYRSA